MAIDRASIYKLLYRSWKRQPKPVEPGYTLLLLVPGDLPVFTELAMTVSGRQASEERVETLVLPDADTDAFRRVFERHRRDWEGPIRVVPLRRLEEMIARRRQRSHLNAWLQLKTGINHARGTHAIWHDSDLFLRNDRYLDDHYRSCRDRGLALLGASQVYEEFRRQGFPHIVSTWELVFETSWAREFKPWEHRGHDGHVDGRPVTFDNMFWPQIQTPPERISRQPTESDFFHFNHTIGSYRKFQRSLRGDEPYEDTTFRVLLVRLLADVLDESKASYEAPSVAELVAGLENPNAMVTYGRTSRAGYESFRSKLQDLATGEFLEQDKAEALLEGIRPFDEAFDWRAEAVSP